MPVSADTRRRIASPNPKTKRSLIHIKAGDALPRTVFWRVVNSFDVQEEIAAMSPALFEIGVALVMVAVAVSLLVWFTRDQRANSERRMTRMLVRAGVDPDLAARGDKQAIVKDIRSRCRRCAAENLCERWLAGKVGGENTFCPNERIFSALANRSSEAPRLQPH